MYPRTVVRLGTNWARRRVTSVRVCVKYRRCLMRSVWPAGGVIVMPLDLRRRGRKLTHGCEVTILFTHACASVTEQYAGGQQTAIRNGWEGNRRSSVPLAMRH